MAEQDNWKPARLPGENGERRDGDKGNKAVFCSISLSRAESERGANQYDDRLGCQEEREHAFCIRHIVYIILHFSLITFYNLTCRRFINVFLSDIWTNPLADHKLHLRKIEKAKLHERARLAYL
ncbi:hypothetical protein KP509_30G062500 [Ceratopteris richardii]|uniref:Uncharacterized protein n=1 Tax=Ceratopteris richardii TaxID=49495 RepID=A0A8T2R324_CERRI|nr:hypothetical protein KP509_30G062500 [Ceratopteris richardii]